jgi:hypothetical protein
VGFAFEDAGACKIGDCAAVDCVCVCVSVRVVGVEIVGVVLCSGDVTGDSMEGSFWAIQASRGKFGREIACCGGGCDIFAFGDFTLGGADVTRGDGTLGAGESLTPRTALAAAFIR